MFEIDLKDMNSLIFIESGMFEILTASNVGLRDSGIVNGWNRYSYCEAVSIIKEIDVALLSCPKYFRKRVLATRREFTNAFGPEMETVVGRALE